MTKTVPWKENLQNVVRSSFVLIIRKKQPILHISSYIENIRKSELLPQSTQNQGLRIFATQKRLKNQFLFRGQQPDGWCYRCNRCCSWRGHEISLINQHFQSFAHFGRGSFSVQKPLSKPLFKLGLLRRLFKVINLPIIVAVLFNTLDWYVYIFWAVREAFLRGFFIPE